MKSPPSPPPQSSTCVCVCLCLCTFSYRYFKVPAEAHQLTNTDVVRGQSWISARQQRNHHLAEPLGGAEEEQETPI
jgi:hypothetical protein